MPALIDACRRHYLSTSVLIIWKSFDFDDIPSEISHWTHTMGFIAKHSSWNKNAIIAKLDADNNEGKWLESKKAWLLVVLPHTLSLSTLIRKSEYANLPHA